MVEDGQYDYFSSTLYFSLSQHSYMFRSQQIILIFQLSSDEYILICIPIYRDTFCLFILILIIPSIRKLKILFYSVFIQVVPFLSFDIFHLFHIILAISAILFLIFTFYGDFQGSQKYPKLRYLCPY